MEKITVSLFDNYRDKTPKQVDLWEWLLQPDFKEVIEKIRTLENKEERDKLKSTLPCITPSGMFNTRKASELIEHSGYICIDIDAKDNPAIHDFSSLRNELANIINVAYAALSVSGKGVFCLIPIAYPEKHKQHFEALKTAFLSLNITIDKSCGDVSRLRGCTYDTHAHVNREAVVFKHTFEYEEVRQMPSIKLKNCPKLKSTKDNKGKVLEIISRLEKSGIDITENYNQWVEIAGSLANEFGEEGRSLFHAVSQINPGYNASHADNLFSNCLAGNYSYSIGTFFHWAKEYGVKM